MGISDPDSPPPRLQLFLCPLPLKVSASCGGGHSKWAYISYWDLGRIQQKMNCAQLNQIQGFRQTYCDSRPHYSKLLWHDYFMDLCRAFVKIQQSSVLPPHPLAQSTARYYYKNVGVLGSSKFSMYHKNCASPAFIMCQIYSSLVEDWGCNNWFSHATCSVHIPIQEKGRVRGHTLPLYSGHTIQPHFLAHDYS